MVPEYINLTEDQTVMGFASSCVEWVAEELHIDYQEAFRRLDKFGLIESFIIGCYPALHTQSKEHVTEDIIHALKVREQAV